MRVETVTEMAVKRMAVLLCCSFLFACSGSDDKATPKPVQTEPLQLLKYEELVKVPAAEDPFPDRPSEVICPENTYGPDEPSGFEVFTGKCNYYTGVHVLQYDVEEGRRLTVEAGHAELKNTLHELDPEGGNPSERDPSGPQRAPEGTGHIAIQIDDTVVWEKTEKIPSIGRYWVETFIAKQTWPAGTFVYFHVHNHGFNTWRFLGLTLEPPIDP